MMDPFVRDRLERVLLITDENATAEKITARLLLDGLPVKGSTLYCGGSHIFFPEKLKIPSSNGRFTIYDGERSDHIGFCRPLSPLELLANVTREE